jgi:anti-sigma-K factor RskA
VTEHKEIGDLLPGYALGCLDAEEERAAREHLAGCAQCREELASLQGIVGGLASSVPATPPPAHLEGRIMAAAEKARSAPRPKLVRLRGRPRSVSRFAVAAAAAIVILGAGNILQWQGSRPSSAPAASKGLMTLALAGRGAGAGSFGTVVLDPEDNEGVLAVRGLASLDPSRRYQLWLAKDGLRASGGSFSVDARGYGSLLLDVPAEFRNFNAFLITVEPARGSAAPTSEPVMEGKR